MKTLQIKSRNALLILSILATALSGCGGSSGGSSGQDFAAVMLCIFSAGLLCPASSARVAADASGGYPPAVTELSASVPPAASGPEIALQWQAAVDEARILGYRVYRDGEPIADTGKTEFTDSVVGADTRYCYEVTAYDESRNESPRGEPACATTSWLISSVDSGILAPHAALALDSLGQVHFAYFGYDRQEKRNIRYANRLTGQWAGEDTGFVASALAEDLSLVVDATGAVHIGNLDQYLTNRFGNWHREAREAHNFTAFSFDSRGYIHAVSGDGAGGFSHATNTAGGWHYEPLGEGEWQRLAAIVDDDDVMHVAYYNYAARELRYLENRSGIWAGEVVASDLGPVWHLDLAVDARGSAHLVYRLQPEDGTARQAAGADARGGLEYATNAGGSWQRQLLDRGAGTGSGAAIAVDSGGSVHVSYRGTGSELRYLTNVSGGWELTVVDGGKPVDADCGLAPDLCGATDIAVDSSGRVHIGYPVADRVMYAVRG